MHTIEILTLQAGHCWYLAKNEYNCNLTTRVKAHGRYALVNGGRYMSDTKFTLGPGPKRGTLQIEFSRNSLFSGQKLVAEHPIVIFKLCEAIGRWEHDSFGGAPYPSDTAIKDALEAIFATFNDNVHVAKIIAERA